MSNKNDNISVTSKPNKLNILLQAVNIKSRRSKSLLAIIVVVFVMVVILLVGVAFSWFAPKKEADLTVTTTDFETETLYSFASSEFAPLTDKINFGIEQFNSLKLKIKFTGPSSAYIRVQLFENFSKDSNMYPATPVSYTLSPDWVKIGDYYYYKKIVTYTEVTETDENGKNVRKRVSTEIPFVTSASSSYNTTNNSGVNMNLVAVVEAVQPDRFEEFFGADPELLFANN